MNIFDLRRTAVSRRLCALLVAGIGVGVALRNRMRGSAVDADVKTLDSCSRSRLALLADGEDHAVRTALAGLAHRELITVEPKRELIKATGNAPLGHGQRRDCDCTRCSALRRTRSPTCSLRTESMLARTRQRLAAHSGLLIECGDRWQRAARAGAAVLGVVLAIGLYKVGLGMQRGRP